MYSSVQSCVRTNELNNKNSVTKYIVKLTSSRNSSCRNAVEMEKITYKFT